MIKQLLIFRFIHIIIDFLGIFSAFLLAYFLRIGWIFSSDFLFWPYAKASFFASIIWVLFLLFTRFYKIFPENSRTEKLLQGFKIFGGGVLAVGFLIVFYFFKSDLFFSRMINLLSLLGGSVFFGDFFGEFFGKFLGA